MVLVPMGQSIPCANNEQGIQAGDIPRGSLSFWPNITWYSAFFYGCACVVHKEWNNCHYPVIYACTVFQTLLQCRVLVWMNTARSRHAFVVFLKITHQNVLPANRRGSGRVVYGFRVDDRMHTCFYQLDTGARAELNALEEQWGLLVLGVRRILRIHAGE